MAILLSLSACSGEQESRHLIPNSSQSSNIEPTPRPTRSTRVDVFVPTPSNSAQSSPLSPVPTPTEASIAPTSIPTHLPTPEPSIQATPTPVSQPPTPTISPIKASPTPTQTLNQSDQILTDAFKTQKSNVQVQGKGSVLRILADDNDGDRHQRFILKLASGHTLLIAHNIDLATKITALKVGDSVEFFGEYEWNDQGGVIHWTHKDPQQDHVDGWLKHKGAKYD